MFFCLAMPTDDGQPKTSDTRNKKNFKIWFSPKSRKVRCCVEKPVAINLSNGDRERKPLTPPSSKPKDLSVFNFTSSSQDSDTSSPPRGKVNRKTKSKRVCPTSKQARSAKNPKTQTCVKLGYKRLKLEAVNQQWGVGKESSIDGKDKEGEKVSSGDDTRRSGKTVSFKCLTSLPEEPNNLVSQDETQVLSLDESIFDNLEVEETQTCFGKQNSDHDRLPDENTQGSSQPSSSGTSHGDDSQTTPKRLQESSPRGRKRFSRVSPPAEGLGHGVRTSRQSEHEQNVKAVVSPSQRRSAVMTVLGRKSHGVRSKRESLLYMKRNHMGETPLHLAAIKVCVSSLEQ